MMPCLETKIFFRFLHKRATEDLQLRLILVRPEFTVFSEVETVTRISDVDIVLICLQFICSIVFKITDWS